MPKSVMIAGTGSWVSPEPVSIYSYEDREWLDKNGEPYRHEKTGELMTSRETIESLLGKTGIEAMSIAPDDVDNSDLAFEAVSNIDADLSDVSAIIVGHNTANAREGHVHDLIPALAMRKKAQARIEDSSINAFDVAGDVDKFAGVIPSSIPYEGDVPSGEHFTVHRSDFEPLSVILREKLGLPDSVYALDAIQGCPVGELVAEIGRQLLYAQGKGRVLAIGSEKLHPLKHRNDKSANLIFGDAAGAVLLEIVDTEDPRGFLSYASLCDAYNANPRSGVQPIDAIVQGDPTNPHSDSRQWVNMNGHAVYQWVSRNLPNVITASIEEANEVMKPYGETITVDSFGVFNIHPAGKKTVNTAVRRLKLAEHFGCFDDKGRPDPDVIPESVLPRLYRTMGNGSGAGILVNLDHIMRGKTESDISPGKYMLMTVPGASMVGVSAVYRF